MVEDNSYEKDLKFLEQRRNLVFSKVIFINSLSGIGFTLYKVVDSTRFMVGYYKNSRTVK